MPLGRRITVGSRRERILLVLSAAWRQKVDLLLTINDRSAASTEVPARMGAGSSHWPLCGPARHKTLQRRVQAGRAFASPMPAARRSVGPEGGFARAFTGDSMGSRK
jgi:hypothetical protein